MPVKCKTCNHERRAEIEKEIVKGAPSPNYSLIAKNFDVSYQSLTYHAKHHFSPVLEKAEEKAAEQLAENIVIRVTELHGFVHLPPIEQAMFMQHTLMLELEDLNKNVEETDETRDLLKTLKGIYGMGDPFARTETKVKVVREILRWADFKAKVDGTYKNAGDEKETDKHKEFARQVHANAFLQKITFERSLDLFLNTILLEGGKQKPLKDILKLTPYDIEKIRDEGKLLSDKQPLVMIEENAE